MNDKHTPLPWRAEGQQIVAQENDYCVAVVSSPHPRARGKEHMEDLEYCRGNTAFIVTACNSHEKLVAALRLAKDDHQRARPHHADLCAICAAIDAALAAAEEA